MAGAVVRSHARLEVASWVLYDFANTIFSLNIVSLYFSLWVINVMGRRDADYALAASLSMAAVFVASPFLGALSDQAPRRMPFLVASTLACAGFTFALGAGGLAVALACFGVANFAYQAGLQFYDALLPEVTTEANRGRVGGLGISLGYVGAVAGLLIGRAILGDADSQPAAEQTARYTLLFRVTAVLCLLFALPCFFGVRERVRSERRLSWASIPAAFRQVTATMHDARRHPELVRFLGGRALYTDAVNTVVLFMGIYVTNEVGFASGAAPQVLLVAILGAAAGGLIWGRVVDTIGPGPALRRVLVLWVGVFTWTAASGLLALPTWTFWPVPIAAGIALGGTWTADRPLLLRLAPPDRIGEFYGLYGMVGRFAAITGPLVWGLVADVLGLGRPAAVLTLLAAVLASLVVLRPVLVLR